MSDQQTKDLHPEFSWQAHPAAERLGAAVAAGAAVLALGLGVWAASGSLPWAAAGMVLVVGSLNRFFFPSRFAIDPEGITARFPLRTQRARWADVRRFVTDARGGYLSTRVRRSRLDAYHGLHVLFGRRRDAVVRQIRSHLLTGGTA